MQTEVGGFVLAMAMATAVVEKAQRAYPGSARQGAMASTRITSYLQAGLNLRPSFRGCACFIRPLPGVFSCIFFVLGR